MGEARVYIRFGNPNRSLRKDICMYRGTYMISFVMGNKWLLIETMRWFFVLVMGSSLSFVKNDILLLLFSKMCGNIIDRLMVVVKCVVSIGRHGTEITEC